MKLSLIYLNLLHAASDGFSSALILLLPFISQSLNINLTQVGILGSTFTLLTILLAIPAGSLSIRFGGMRVLTTAVLAYGLGYIFMPFAWSFYSLLPIFIFSAAGFSLFNPIGYGLVARFADIHKRGKAIGTFSAFGDIGKLILTPFLTLIVVAFGWRNTSFFYGGLALVFFLFLVFSHFKDKRIHEKQERPNELDFRTLVKNKKFMFACMCGVVDYMSSYPLFVFLPFVLLTKGVPEGILGMFLGAYFVGNLIGKPFLGGMTDKKGHVKTFIIAELLTATSIILLIFASNIYLIALLTLALGMLGKGTTPVTQTMVTEASEHHGNFEKSIAFYSLIGNITAMIGTISLGFLSDTFGVVSAFTFTAILALLAIIPAVGYRIVKN